MQKGFKGLLRGGKCLKCHQVPQYMNRNIDFLFFVFFFSGTASLVLVDLMVE